MIRFLPVSVGNTAYLLLGGEGWFVRCSLWYVVCFSVRKKIAKGIRALQEIAIATTTVIEHVEKEVFPVSDLPVSSSTQLESLLC